MDYTWVYFDSASFGTAAGATHTLFNVARGGDSTHTKDYTNMRTAGQLPQNENFTVNKIAVWVDEEIAEADLPIVWETTTILVAVNERTVLEIPLRMVAGYNGYQGELHLASEADTVLIGPAGQGFDLPEAIQIEGNDSFRVELYQGTALSAATLLKVAMIGILDRQET